MSQATLGSEPYRNSNLFSGYYLDERVDDLEDWEADDEAEAVFEVLRELWDVEGKLVSSYGEDELLDQWIGEVLQVLGFDTISEGTLPDGGGHVDRLLFESEEERRSAAGRKLKDDQVGMFSRASALLEAKQWRHDFEKRFSEERSYRDASHQVKYYLERTPGDLQWGILTDGKKWRLYGTKDYETQTYYEVDLPELLESGDLEQFKYFYCFFRPEAFEEIAGTSFLETVWTESETAAQELGEDLQDNVFTALRVLGKGFVENNDLGIDPADEDARDELKEQSLVLLYRLMFVLYAESRGLIDPDDHEANAEYHDNFSLEKIRGQIIDEVEGKDVESSEAFHDEFSDYSTTIWNRLSRLFELIDEGEDELDIPPYNGGLFDHDDHEFLADNEVTDPIIAEVIFRLSTTENEDGEYVPADYADLDTRHLGSIYEGLLEHEFRIAPEEGMAAVSEDGGQVWKPAADVSVVDAVEVVDGGGLYVVNDDGERKATGAYYTPDYVVTYIVEETVDPLIEEIHEDLESDDLDRSDTEYFRRFYDRVTDLTILDPAMGSAHFLTKATGYLTEQVMEVVREQEIQSYDEQDIRREISKEAIYGVDLNGMAVELAKLSMWLETLAADQPLAFLDHHLKHGNSLVGSDITEVLSEDAGVDGDDGQITLTQAFARVRQGTLEHVMELMSDLLAYDNETLEDVKSMEELYDEIRDDPLYSRLFELANIHTAERFGADVPQGAYEQMAGAIEDKDEWTEIAQNEWFNDAQAIAEKEDFFHWELEFPEIFFDRNGEKIAKGGFDIVIGNPPYVKIQNIRGRNPSLADYASTNYSTSTARFDLYSLFVERGHTIAAEGNLGYILPNKFFESGGGKGLRNYLMKDGATPRKIVDFQQKQVFEGATTYTCLLFLSGSGTIEYGEVNQELDVPDLSKVEYTDIAISELDEKGWILTGPEERRVMEKMRESDTTVADQTSYISEGIVSGGNEVIFVEVEDWGDNFHTIRSEVDGKTYQVEAEIARPLRDGDEIERYGSTDADQAVIYPYQIKDGKTQLIKEKELESKYPKSYNYLKNHQDQLSDRGSATMEYPCWYSLWRPREKQIFESKKLLVPDICQRSEFTLDKSGETCIPNSAYAVVPQNEGKTAQEYLLSVLNSSATWFYLYHTSSILRGDYRRFMTSYLGPIPLPGEGPAGSPKISGDEYEQQYKNYLESTELQDIDSKDRFLAYLGGMNMENHANRRKLNVDILDHVVAYGEGPDITGVGLIQPTENSRKSILHKDATDHPNLQVGSARVVRESLNTVLIEATARYKPEDEDAYETDQWGYTETEYQSAFRITDLTETEADLIEHFVPVAVDEAGGFANFRETATKTNSLIDRLKAIELPNVDDVADDLDNYLQTKERAEELDEKIEKTDQLIDEIVYDLYGLTDEEIETVESAVAND